MTRGLARVRPVRVTPDASGVGAPSDRSGIMEHANVAAAKGISVALTSTHGRGELERAVLACLASAPGTMTSAPGAMTPAQVQAALGHDLAYTTVMTTLARLHAKKVLRRTAQGRAYAYALIGNAATAQSGLTAHRMVQALEAGADRAGVLARFVDDLSAEDEALLVAALENAQRDPAEGVRRKGTR